MMRNLPACAIALSASLFSGASLSTPLPIAGQWRILDEADGREMSVVHIYEHGGRMFGKIVSARDSLDENGKPKLCTRCEGADRNKPFLGLVIIKDLVPDGDGYAGGTITDPTSGKVYRCAMEATDGGKKLKVRGFIGFSLLGRTQTWLRK